MNAIAAVKTIGPDSRVSELFDRFLANAATRPFSENSVKSEAVCTNDFVAFFLDAKISEVTAERADAWRISLLQRFKQNTARTRISIVKSAFRYAVSIDILLKSPVDSIVLPKMVFTGRIVSDRILSRYLKEFPVKMRRAMKLIIYTGMRRTEAVMLDWSEVKGCRIILAPHRTKSRRGRTIFLNSSARRCLGPRKHGRVFPYSPSYYNKFATRAWRKLGIGRFRIHDMRHVAATRYSEKNHDDDAMLSAFDWASRESAKPYRHITDARERRNMSRITYSF